MVRFSSILAAAACFVAVESVDIKVDSKGGNATSGHQYGFLHEVDLDSALMMIGMLTWARILTTPVMAASTLNSSATELSSTARNTLFLCLAGDQSTMLSSPSTVSMTLSPTLSLFL